MKDSKRYNIIVGSGISGLVAGYELSKKRPDVLVLEKEDRIGGLLQTSTIKQANNAMIEDCYHNIFATYLTILDLSRELGLGKDIQWETATTAFYYKGEAHKMSTPFDFLGYKDLSFLARLRVALLMVKIKYFIKDSMKYDKLTAKEWIIKKAGKEAYYGFFRRLITGKFEGDADQISASWFITRMQLRTQRNMKGEVIGFYRKGGFIKLANALVKAIEHNGGQVRIKSGVKRFNIKNGKIDSVVLYNNKTIKADIVISTIAPYFLFKFAKFPSSFKKKIDVGYHGTISILLMTKKKITDFYWINMMGVGKKEVRFKALVEQTNWTPLSNYNGAHFSYLASYPHNNDPIWKKTPKQITEIYIKDFLKAFPNMKRSDIIYAQPYLYRDAGTVPKKGDIGRMINYDYTTPYKNLFTFGIFNSFPEGLTDPLAIMARKLTSKISYPKSKGKVAIVIPAYKAEKTLPEVFKRLKKLPRGSYDMIIVTNRPAPGDRTEQVAKRLGAKIVINDYRKGYGIGQIRGYQEALKRGAEYMIMIHADAQYPPEKIPEILEKFRKEKADVVIASRSLGKGMLKGGMPLHKYIGNKVLTAIANIVYRARISEYHSGYKSYSRKALENTHFEIGAHKFEYDADMNALCMMKKMKFVEIPIPTRYAGEVSHLNPVQYGTAILRILAGYKLHKWGIRKSPKYLPKSYVI